MGRRGAVATRVAAALGVLVLVLGGSQAAFAHGGPADIEVGDPEPVGELEVAFPIRVTYQNDGHPVEELEGATLTGVGPGGVTVGPFDPFSPGDAPGVFVATVALPEPGIWELSISVVEPPSEASLTAEVGAPDAHEGDVVDPADAPDAADPAETADDTVEVETADDVAELDEGGDEGGEDAATTDDDGDGAPFLFVLLAFMAAVVAGTLGFRFMRNRTTGAGS